MKNEKCENVYLEQVYKALPRVLALFNTNELAPTYGFGDRFHWAWKLIDFSNGTFQGAANGLARLLHAHLLPYGLAEERVLDRVDAMFHGAEHMRRRDGSYEEAFPYESSFCVSALVAHDLLSAIELLGDRLEEPVRTRYLDCVAPTVRFLLKHDETHGFITNHRATAVSALFRWHRLTQSQEADKRAGELLEEILDEQSAEGWYREYDGADAGYQSLAMVYLTDVHRMRPDLGLADSLARGVDFLSYTAHPDHSFGGWYGSRNTRFWLPGGLEMLAVDFPIAAALCRHMREAVAEHRVPALDCVDTPNLIPMFNAYCLAATQPFPVHSDAELPCCKLEPFSRSFPDAGWFVEGGAEYYRIVSTHKGGVVAHFDRKTGKVSWDTGVVLRDGRGRFASTQACNPGNRVAIDDDAVIINSTFTELHQQLPTPFRFICLRILNLTILRWRPVRESFKRMVVRWLITGSKRWDVRNRRTIRRGAALQITDQQEGSVKDKKRIDIDGPFSAIHMASQGYWQEQDDQT